MKLVGKPRAMLKLSDAVSFVDAAAGDEPAREIRLYKYGWNSTTKGRLWFDDEAADFVMAEFDAHGVAGMVDLEHLSLDETSPSFDPDARGAYQLEVRRDANDQPELWMVTSWAPDGDARIREKRQRYVSPVVEYFEESRRICGIYNIALVANPATDNAMPLIAASRGTTGAIRRTAPFGRQRVKLAAGLSLQDRCRAVESALATMFPPADEYGCGPWVSDLYETSAVYQHDGKLWEISYSFDGTTVTLGASPVEVQRSTTYVPVGAPVAPPPPPPNAAPPVAMATKDSRPSAARKRTAMATEIKLTPENLPAVVAALGLPADTPIAEIIAALTSLAMVQEGKPNPTAGTPPASDAEAKKTADAPPPSDKDEEEETPAAALAAANELLRITGKKRLAAACDYARESVALRSTFDAASAKLAQDRETLEAGERSDLYASLVSLGAETPATLFVDSLAEPKVVVERLSKEPIADLRKRVTALSAARGGKPVVALGAAPRPPISHGGAPPAAPAGESFQTRKGTVSLSAREIADCKELGADPQDYAENKAIHLAARGGTAA